MVSVDQIQSFFRTGIILDTNILILHLVGSFDVSKIKTFKRTVSYTPDDFVQLSRFLKQFKNIYTLPTVLAETWNLLDSFEQKNLEKIIGSSVKILNSFEDYNVEKIKVLSRPQLNYIGFTDVSIALCAKEKKLLILTDDFRAAKYLGDLDASVINFTNLRFQV